MDLWIIGDNSVNPWTVSPWRYSLCCIQLYTRKVELKWGVQTLLTLTPSWSLPKVPKVVIDIVIELSVFESYTNYQTSHPITQRSARCVEVRKLAWSELLTQILFFFHTATAVKCTNQCNTVNAFKDGLFESALLFPFVRFITSHPRPYDSRIFASPSSSAIWNSYIQLSLQTGSDDTSYEVVLQIYRNCCMQPRLILSPERRFPILLDDSTHTRP